MLSVGANNEGSSGGGKRILCDNCSAQDGMQTMTRRTGSTYAAVRFEN